MKRIILSLALSILAMLTNAAELNIYASGLKFNGDIDPITRKATISYFLNAPATALEVQLLDASRNIIHTIAITEASNLTKGAHNNVEISFLGAPNGQFTWAIKATATDQTTALTHVNASAVYKDKYYSPRGLTVDNSTESPYLGRIYIAESLGGTTTAYTYDRTTDEGIYILNPALDDINYGTGNASNDLAYDGGVSWDGSTNGPLRIATDNDGFLYICDNGSSTSGVWRMDPAHPENNFKEVLATSKRGTNYNRIGSILITGEGDNKSLYAIDNNMSVGSNSISHLKKFALSTLPNTAAGDNIIDLCDVVVSNNTIVPDNRNGFWIFQNRSIRDGYPAILHYRYADGTYIQDINTSKSGEQYWMVPESAPNNGGCGAISKDGKLLAFYGNERILIYSIGYDSNGQPTTADKIHDLTTGYTTINAMAFDIANNLYMISNIKERFYAYALRESESTTNTCTTPAPSSQTITIDAELNIYASNLRFHGINANNGKATISYFLNATATSVEFQLLDQSQAVVLTVPLNAPGYLTKGQHNNVEIDLFNLPSGQYTWAIKATADAQSNIARISDESTRFNFYSPAGLAIDNSYNSPYLGRIYISDSFENKKTSAGRLTNQGIYILGADLTDVTNQGNTAYDGNVAWNSSSTVSGSWAEDQYAPARIAIDDLGYVYICDNGPVSSRTSGVWRMDPDNPSNKFNEVLTTSQRGTIYTRANSLAVVGSGENRKLYLVDNNANNQPVLRKYTIGDNLPYANAGEALVDLYSHDIVQSLNTLVRGCNNDFWVFQYRGQIDECPVIAHYNKDMQKDFIVDINNNASLVPTTNPNRRGAGAVSPDGKLLAFHGEQRIYIYDIAYDANGVPALSNQRTISGLTSSNVDCIAFDVANNLYFASASKEWFYACALPKSENNHTTPAPVSQAITIADAVPHIMAYNLNVEQNGKYYDFSFYANSDATSGKLLFYDNMDALVGEIAIMQPINKGNNLVKILTNEVPNGVDMTWKLQLTGQPNPVFGPVFTESRILQRAHSVIDNSPESDYFGRIYVANRVSGGVGECYIYNYDYTPILSQSLCGMTKFQSASRPAVDAEGYVYWADYGDDHGGIWVMDPNTLTTTAFFEGTQDPGTGLWKNSSSTYMGSSSSGAHIYSSGANTKLFAMNEDAATGLYKNSYNVYNIGQSNGTIQRTWNQAPSQAVEVSDNMGEIFSIVGTSHGAWLCQNRCNGTNGGGSYSLMFYDNNGDMKYRSRDNALIITGSYGAGMAVSTDETKLAMVSGSNSILLFDIEWTDDTPTLTLNTTYRIPYNCISTIHFDYAGNLITSAGTIYAGFLLNADKTSLPNDLRLVVFSTPTDNNTTTIPARKHLTITNKITLLDTEDNTDLLDTHKNSVKNTSVFRSLTAGMYNTLCLPFDVPTFTGTPLENATVWQYNGATAQGEGNNQEIYLDFTEVTSMVAGQPYLVEPDADIIAPMEFKGVTISTENGSEVTQPAVTMHGILHPTELQANNKSILFLVENNNLAWANETAYMKGMRAYFKVNEPSLLTARTRAYIRKEPTVATDMENITTTDTEIKKVIYNGTLYIIRGDEVYTIQGTKVK